MKKVSKNSRGSVLVLVVVGMVVLLITGVGLALGLQSRIFSFRDGEAITAKCTADAGLMRQLYKMNYDQKPVTPPTPPGSGLVDGLDTVSETLDNGTNFTAIRNGSWPPGNANYVITSTGSSNNITRTVNARLRSAGIFDSAITVRQSFDFGNNLEINGDVIVISPTGTITGSGSVAGNIYLAQGNTLSNISNSLTASSKQILPYTPEMPIIYYTGPALPNFGIALDTAVPLNDANSGMYSGIPFNNHGTLTVGVGQNVTLIITGDIAGTNGGTITIRSGASLKIYADGKVGFKNNLVIANESNNAGSFRLYGTGGLGQSISMKNNGDIFGTIYAPNADVSVQNNFGLTGSIVANSVVGTPGNNTTFNYSASLRQYNKSDPGVYLVIQNWWE